MHDRSFIHSALSHLKGYVLRLQMIYPITKSPPIHTAILARVITLVTQWTET